MKINWGTGIVISFILFISFIVFLVVTMVKDTDHELVTTDYYQKELLYQKEIDAETNANSLPENIKIVKVNGGVNIEFPKEFEPQKLKGTISFYRPSNQKLDFELPIKLSQSTITISEKNLVEGLWKVTIFWNYDKKPFLYKGEIMY